MFRTQREKTLAAVFGGALSAVILWQCVGQYAFQPITGLQQQIRGTSAQQEELTQQMAVADRAAADLAQLSIRSLPADPATASVMYQHWLIRQLDKSQISDAVVAPGSAVPIEHVGHRIPFSVSATTTLPQIGAFLDDIHTTPLLHRITHLKIAAAGNPSSKIRTLTLNLEAITVEDSETGMELPAPAPVSRHVSLLRAFAGQDLFQRRLPKKPLPKAVKDVNPSTRRRQTPPPRRPESMRFIGSVRSGSSRRAWFVNQKSNTDYVLAPSESVSLGQSKLVVVSVMSDAVDIQLDGASRTLTLGEAVHESIPRGDRTSGSTAHSPNEQNSAGPA